MSAASAPIGLGLKLQPPPGHGNSKHHAPNHPRSSSISLLKQPVKLQKQPHHHVDPSKKYPISNHSSVINDDKRSDNIGSTSRNAASNNMAPKQLLQQRSTPFNKDWVCTSRDFIRNGTPSRRHGISYHDEMSLRKKGTNFIRHLVSSLKARPICKETAYVYFHRFYMLQSLRKFDPIHIAMACVYLACKYEDFQEYPAPKEKVVKVAYYTIYNKMVDTSEKIFADWCERLINEESLLLQVLGFNLKIDHFQVHIVTASQRPIKGTSKTLYTNAYKIASEINRLTMLCVEYPSPILASVAIYLAASYQGIALPDDWCATINGLNAHDVKLVSEIGNEYKELLANHSDIVRVLQMESGMHSTNKTNPQSHNDAASTPQHSAYYGKDPLGLQPFSVNFSPDSAYSSNSSPPENGSSSFHSHNAQYHHSNNHPTNQNYHVSSQNIYMKQSQQQRKHISADAYSPPEMPRTNSIKDDYMWKKDSQNGHNVVNTGSVTRHSSQQSTANQSNTHVSSSVYNNFKNQKRKDPPTSVNLTNSGSMPHFPRPTSTDSSEKKFARIDGDSLQKRFKSGHPYASNNIHQ